MKYASAPRFHWLIRRFFEKSVTEELDTGGFLPPRARDSCTLLDVNMFCRAHCWALIKREIHTTFCRVRYSHLVKALSTEQGNLFGKSIRIFLCIDLFYSRVQLKDVPVRRPYPAARRCSAPAAPSCGATRRRSRPWSASPCAPRAPPPTAGARSISGTPPPPRPPTCCDH